ncbi:MAG: prolyl oligopeptidase family serine peptidase [Clostridia bacterium]|nr:prolyl oligopeptidase family serine peptidase [Clostridia bacterium]
MRKLISLILVLSMLVSAFSLCIAADAPTLDENETEIMFPEGTDKYVASVVLNANGDGFEVGEYELLTEETELTGLYWLAKNANGKGKVLQYARGEAEPRKDYVPIETITRPTAEYSMVRLKNSENWIPGTWTGKGLTNTIQSYGYGQAVAGERWFIPYANVDPAYHEKLYLYTHDKEATLAIYENNFGKDSEVYTLVEDYYGDLDADGMAAEVAEIHKIAKETFEANRVRYALTSEQIIPVSELKSIKFSAYYQQGMKISGTVYGQAVFHVALPDGTLVSRTWESGANNFTGIITYNVDVQSTPNLPTEGWIVGIELLPYGRMGDDVTFEAVVRNLTETAQGLRFLNTQFLPMVYPETNVITEQETKPELKHVYEGDGLYRITITNAEADATYAYKTFDGEWTTLSAGVSSFIVDNQGYYYVKAVGTDGTVDSIIARTKIELKQSTPELTLGEGYTLIAPDDATYEIAKLVHATEPVYETFTEKTLTAGVWAVRKVGDEAVPASDPQYFYIEGEDAGSIIFGTAAGTELTEGKWTGTLGTANLYDTTSPNWTTTSTLYIFSSISTAHFDENHTYSTYGYRYKLRESEIIPVSALKDISVVKTSINPTFSYMNGENSVTITKNRTLARVYVVGADVPYYEVYDDGGSVKAGYMDFKFPLSQLADKEGYVTAIELYPVYRFLDADGNVIENPQINGDRSWALCFSPLEMDENITVSNKTGFDTNGNNKFSLKIAEKAETPILAVQRAGDKFRINITNAVDGYTYQYKVGDGGWRILEKGAKSFIVDSVGSYSVKSLASGNVLSSNVGSIYFEGVKATPSLVLGEGNVLIAPDDGETYQYARLGYNTVSEYSDFTSVTLTAGVWAVRVKGTGNILESDSQTIYVMGEDAGTVRFATSTSLDMTKGLWTGTLDVAKLFDWDKQGDANDETRFTDTHIEVYSGLKAEYFTNNTYPDYGYRYILEDSEIVGLDDLVDLNAKRKAGNGITCDGAAVNYTRTRARVHVVGGDADYYDVYTVSNFGNINHGFDFALSQLNDKKGYVVAIELYLFDALTDSTGNELEGTITTVDSSYGITFSNLILHEDVTLASQANHNTGLSADGDNRYSLKIANDTRAPKFERLESNPNRIVITNYIQGARYAWATSLDGEWTEFEGNTVEFMNYGSYYLKLIGDETYPELVNSKPFTTADIVITGASLVLDGAIGVKVYFDAENGAQYKASYSVVDKNTEEEVYAEANAKVTLSSNGKYSFVVPVYPKDADNLEVCVTVNNLTDDYSLTATTGVRTYIDLLKRMAEAGDEACIEALDVVDAMETYIAYAHNYFYKDEAELTDNITIDLDALNATPNHVVVDDGTLKCASLVGVSLLLEGETSIRYYFQVTDAAAFAAYRGYCNEAELPVIKKSDSIYYFEVADIAAHNINKAYTLELYDGNNNAAVKVTFRATNYIKGMINSTEERLPALMKALYNYYVESAKYYEISKNAGQRAEIIEAMNRAKATTLDQLNVRRYEAYESDVEGYTHIQAITYDAFEYKGQKTKNFAYIGFPEGASAENPVPAIVLVHGGGGHPFMEWVRIWNERGYAAIAMETTGCFPTEVKPSYDEPTDEHFVHGLGVFAEDGYIAAPSRSYPTKYTPVDEQWAYHGLTQVILASNILRADERVDNENIGITGVSWGGTMVSQVIGYDNRYSFAIPVYGTAYLATEMHTFSNFNDPYVNSLWAAERNLDNADMPTFWFAFNDDNNFCVPAYCKSYLHTATLNDKNSLLMLNKWSHSHGSVFNKKHPFWFADWVTYGTGGFITFADQPKGAKVNCKLNIPEGIEGDITATVIYIDEPMDYKKWEKFPGKNYTYLTSYWETDSTCLTVDRETGVVSGTVPADAAGYYVNVNYTLEGEKCESSSIYVAVE